jgi:hypothetical protein
VILTRLRFPNQLQNDSSGNRIKPASSGPLWPAMRNALTWARFDSMFRLRVPANFGSRAMRTSVSYLAVGVGLTVGA